MISYTSTLGTVLPESTATFSETDNTVTIQYMVPGDVVTFDLLLDNNTTNVSFNYRTVIEKVVDDGLWDGLVVSFTENNTTETLATDFTRSASDWTLVEAAEWTADRTITVSISLPEERGNEYQNKTCTLAYTIQAVQGNVDELTTAASVQDEMNDGGVISQFGDTIALDNGLTVAEDVVLSNIVLDGSAVTGATITIGDGATLTISDGATIVAGTACFKIADGANATIDIDDFSALIADAGDIVFDIGTGAYLTINTAAPMNEALSFVANNSNNNNVVVITK